MPLYSFDVVDGRRAVDEIGTDLADESEAHREALRRANILLRVTKASDNAGPERSWTIAVKNDTGEVVFRIEAQPGLIAVS